MMIIAKDVKNLDHLLDYLERQGYEVEEGTHAVLLDHSEVARFILIRGGRTAAIMLVHYLTPYYRVEMKDISDEDEYLEELLIIKHSSEEWRIPVEELVFIVFEERLVDLLEKYVDEYPVTDGEELVDHYVKHSHKGVGVLKVLLGRVLDELGSG